MVRLVQETHWRLTRIVAIQQNLQTLTTMEQIDQLDPRFRHVDESSQRAFAEAAAYRANARVFDQLARQEARLRPPAPDCSTSPSPLLPTTSPSSGLKSDVDRPNDELSTPHFTGEPREFKQKRWSPTQAKNEAPQP